MKKLLIIFALLMFSTIGVSAVDYLPHKQNTDLTISFTDNLAGNCNITSMNLPNGSVIWINQQMQKTQNTFNSTITKGNFTELGTYCININCENGYGSICREVTLNGQGFSTGKAISYIGFIIVILFTFLLTLYGAIKVRWEHPRNTNNQIISINNFRYVKVFLFSMTYVLMMFLFGLSYKFFNEANIQGFTDFFYYAYILFERLLIPIMIATTVIFFIIFITNLKIKERLALGLH